MGGRERGRDWEESPPLGGWSERRGVDLVCVGGVLVVRSNGGEGMVMVSHLQQSMLMVLMLLLLLMVARGRQT